MKLAEVLTKEQKSALNVLGPNQRRIEVEWLEYIKLGKELAQKHTDLRFELAELVIKACFKSDGKPKGGKYTVNNFADEIGIPRTTLAEWVSLKKTVIDKLPRKDRSQSISMAKVIRKMAGKRATTEDIQSIYEGIKEKGDGFMKFNSLVKHLTALEYNTSSNLRMKQATQEQLSEIQHKCRNIAFNIEQFFKSQKAKK